MPQRNSFLVTPAGPSRSAQIGQFVALAAWPRAQRVGLLVAVELLGDRIPLQPTPKLPADVHQVANHLSAVSDFGVRHRLLPRADAVGPVLQVLFGDAVDLRAVRGDRRILDQFRGIAGQPIPIDFDLSLVADEDRAEARALCLRAISTSAECRWDNRRVTGQFGPVPSGHTSTGSVSSVPRARCT